MTATQTNIRTAADLHIGERGIIRSFSDSPMSLKLLEMGCLPGTEIKMECIAPLGCPVCITVGTDYHLSLRKSEAATILISVA